MLGVMRPPVRPAPRCGGKGKIIHQPCKTCRGAGAVRKARKITVNIPAGVGYGQRLLRCGDRATRARTAAPPATCIVVAEVRPHAFFRRDGSDVMMEKDDLLRGGRAGR